MAGTVAAASVRSVRCSLRPDRVRRAARSARYRCSGMLAVILAARRYDSRAAAVSPASSSRCARTASSRWVWAIRSSSSRVPSRASPARGPSTIATATARLSVTTGPGDTSSSTSYSARICGQSVSSAARRLVVHRRDRGLELIRADRPGAEGAGDERDALLDLRRFHQVASCSASGTIDPSAVVRAARRASVSSIRASRPATSPSRRHQLVEQPREPDRFGREVGAMQRRAGARRVALVEDEIEHVHHDAEPVRPLGLRREVEAAAGALDALLRPADPLRHRGFGHQERVRDLGRRQPADGAQRERQLRRHGERGMAAQEQERERVVLVARALPGRGGSMAMTVSSRRRRALSLRHSSTSRREATVRSHDRGSSGTPVLGPLLRRGEHRLLHGVLARVELAVAPDERAEDLRRELAQQVLDPGRVDR